MTKIHEETIPLFPLNGVVMFPNTYLPLNVFETRYLKMINHVIASENRLVGIIQPDRSNKEKTDKNLYQVGCAGKIIKFEETENKTYLITLKGLSRFRYIRDTTNQDNFRIASVNWKDFVQDFQEDKMIKNFNELKITLKKFFRTRNIEVNNEAIDMCKDYNLVDQIIMICPLNSAEKQLLLETLSLSQRYILLNSILEGYNNEANISKIIKH